MQYYPSMSPGYVIIAGTGKLEGAVISRDRLAPAHIETLTEDKWFVAQTNDDHFSGIC